MIYLRLALEFFLTGLFSVGGGMATVPFLQKMSASTGWFTLAELADMIAVSESTPGAMGVNAASFVGFRTGGVLGLVLATLALTLPSYIIIMIIARFLAKFRDNRYVKDVFRGLRPASLALIIAAMCSIVRMCAFPAGMSGRGWITLAAVAVLTGVIIKLKSRVHPVVYIAVFAAAGIVFKL
jgi:chromate transporter